MTGRIFRLFAFFIFLWTGVTLQAVQVTSLPSERHAPDSLSGDESRISIAPETIIAILSREPGLTYVIKKKLADIALQQGRLLDEDSFTDSTLYYLIQTDDSIRALVTRELVRRKYVQVRPTDQEAAEEYQRQQKLLSEMSRSSQARQRDGSGAYSASDPERKLRSFDQGCALDGSAANGNCSTTVPLPAPERTPAPTLPNVAATPGSSAGPLPIQPAELPMLLSRTSGGGATPSTSLLTAAFNGGSMPQPALPSESEVLTPSLPAPGRSSATAIDEIPDVILKRKQVPYASVPSLIDLYSQVDRRYDSITRFGASLFNGGDRLKEQLPMDMPAGPEYVVGPGDGLNVEMWGGSASQRLQRVIDREGRLSLPEAGLVEVSGKTLGDVQRVVQAALRQQFRDIRADVSLARLRTVRVYVVGDIKNPGPYDVSSLSTPLNAVLAAGGPTAGGSYRLIRHYHGKQLIQEVDVYDLILNGVRGDIKHLEPGDTVLVPPASSEVTVEGMVRRPAIYELRSETNMAQVLALAGGVLPSGTLRHIGVERIQTHQGRTMLSLDIPETGDDATTGLMQRFKIENGDKIKISPILPYSEKTVFLDGHVFRPGKYPFEPGMRVSDLVKGYSDLLPEPARQYAEIIRLNPPDFRPAVLALNLGSALDKKEDADFQLQAFDTLRIFSRFDFEDTPVINVSGEVRDPGTHRTNGDLSLRDAIYLAGGLTADADLDDAQVFRSVNGRAEFFNVSLGKAMTGDGQANIHLLPRDRVFVHRSLVKVDPPSVNIRGEVATPGRFLFAPGMTVTQLVRLAGGLKRSAYTGNADLERYVSDQGQRISGSHQEIDLAGIVSGNAEDIPLKDGDVLTIRQVSGFEDIGASVTLRGEVTYAGTYGIAAGERLSSVLRRAGGFTALAYPYGIVLTRKNLREVEQKNRAELISRLQQEVAGTSTGSGSQIAQRQALLFQQNQALQRLQSTPALGRQVVQIGMDISRWANTPEDIMLQAGDAIIVPKKPDVVLVSGEIYNPNALTYVPGRSVGWYLRQAGGITELGNRKGIFVVRGDGSVFSRGAGKFFSSDVLAYTLRPGDTIVVPQRLVGSTALKTFTDTATLLSSLAVAARVAISF
jgi:protein involved in polysaccharide export with SLBB domain